MAPTGASGAVAGRRAAVSEAGSTEPLGTEVTADSAATSELEDQLRTHFRSLQDIADTRTMPEMQARLQARLADAVGIAAITHELRRVKAGSVAVTPEAKLALWHDLRDRSFLYLVAATWLLPVLSLLIHVQLTVLGRHMYLESLMRGEGRGWRGWRARVPGAADPPRLAPLTPHQQEAFMSYGAFVLNDGLPALLPVLLQLVRVRTAGHALQDAVSLATVWELLSGVHESIDGQVTPNQWADFLLPPVALAPGSGPAVAAGTPSRADTATSEPPAPRLPPQYYPAGMTPEDACVIAELMLEAREIVQSQAFSTALQTGVKCCAAAAADRLAAAFQPPDVLAHPDAPGAAEAVSAAARQALAPIAAVVPKVAYVAQRVLGDASAIGRDVSDLPEVQAMLEKAYARGPFLDAGDDPRGH